MDAWTKSRTKSGLEKKEHSLNESKEEDTPPVTKVPGLTSPQVMFQESRIL